VACVGPTINRAVLLASWEGRFLLSRFFVSLEFILSGVEVAMEKERRKKRNN